jgi:hypothetical protein
MIEGKPSIGEALRDGGLDPARPAISRRAS